MIEISLVVDKKRKQRNCNKVLLRCSYYRTPKNLNFEKHIADIVGRQISVFKRSKQCSCAYNIDTVKLKNTLKIHQSDKLYFKKFTTRHFDVI